MNNLERIAEMEKQLPALKADIEDKPRRVRVYIKEDAENLISVHCNTSMKTMPGSVFDVQKLHPDISAAIYVWDNNLTSSWCFTKDTYIIVEGSLDDLKN